MHKDNPSEIAEHLAQVNGLEGTVQVMIHFERESNHHQSTDCRSKALW